MCLFGGFQLPTILNFDHFHVNAMFPQVTKPVGCGQSLDLSPASPNDQKETLRYESLISFSLNGISQSPVSLTEIQSLPNFQGQCKNHKLAGYHHLYITKLPPLLHGCRYFQIVVSMPSHNFFLQTSPPPPPPCRLAWLGIQGQITVCQLVRLELFVCPLCTESHRPLACDHFHLVYQGDKSRE